MALKRTAASYNILKILKHLWEKGRRGCLKLIILFIDCDYFSPKWTSPTSPQTQLFPSSTSFSCIWLFVWSALTSSRTLLKVIMFFSRPCPSHRSPVLLFFVYFSFLRFQEKSLYTPGVSCFVFLFVFGGEIDQVDFVEGKSCLQYICKVCKSGLSSQTGYWLWFLWWKWDLDVFSASFMCP